MKKLSFAQLGFLFAGCFFGAGFVSGRELYQYFAQFGAPGYAGFAVSMVLFLLFGLLVFTTAWQTGITEADKLPVPWNSPLLYRITAVLQVIVLFSCVILMTAGIGAMLEQLTGIPAVAGSAAFTVLALVVAMAGLDGMLSVFSFAVPTLVILTFAFGVYSAVKCGGFPEPLAPTSDSGLLGNWLVSGINYTCFNAFASIAVFAPFGSRLQKKRTIFSGVLFGTGMLTVSALSVLVSLCAFPDSVSAELPMLEAAKTLGFLPMLVYAVLLFLAMFGTGISNLVAVSVFFEKKFPKLKEKKKLFLVLLGLTGFLLSLFGFSELVSVVYPITGYLGLFLLAGLIVQFWKTRHRKNAVKE